MNRLATRLRIGEKIGLGFGLVGLILLAVIAYYDLTLRRVISDYQSLSRVYGARQFQAFEIERRLAAMRAAQERFLLTRDLALADEARRQARLLEQEVATLAAVDEASGRTAAELRTLGRDFLARFDAIVEAWEVRGLDEDKGLQGAFRNAVHELEDLAGHYNVDRPYVLLLQVRRREKDLGLRREPGYQDQVHTLLDELSATLAASAVAAGVRAQLESEIATYRSELDAYAKIVLSNRDIAGGKGPFRDAAHRMEAILAAHYIPGLQTEILQLRRREKDYLLRGDAGYVAMVDQILAGIGGQVRSSAIADEEKAHLETLLGAYARDFHALVDQDERIARLTAEMDAAVERITPLVQENLKQANAQMASMSKQLASTSADSARLSLTVAFGAMALGTLFAVLITVRIVRPVRKMAGLLDRLTQENPTERIETDPHGRDEINAMAISLNTMADHKATFFNWWRSSMQEAIALRDLHAERGEDERFEAAEEVRTAAMSKLQQLNAIKGRLLRNADEVRAIGERLDRDASQLRNGDGRQLRKVGAEIGTLVGVIDEG